MYLKRKIDDYLLEWKKHGQTAFNYKRGKTDWKNRVY